ncbi:hypothetical protein L873DRAFT_566778 [Choiromyces venosus 120613-1]|uniref:Uncharacterized protein n=1 Tax=Choiromyces venosus 120613-1 TaxID=1336337 RepID=A0A3N4K7P3_9PEZI|nr:hypothetical protein L873DRAFT_566778 [Choiromyces venosus 120613-1]
MGYVLMLVINSSLFLMYYFFCFEWLAWEIEMRDLGRRAGENCTNLCINNFNLSLLFYHLL